jgi:hypothetical protein
LQKTAPLSNSPVAISRFLCPKHLWWLTQQQQQTAQHEVTNNHKKLIQKKNKVTHTHTTTTTTTKFAYPEAALISSPVVCSTGVKMRCGSMDFAANLYNREPVRPDDPIDFQAESSLSIHHTYTHGHTPHHATTYKCFVSTSQTLNTLQHAIK